MSHAKENVFHSYVQVSWHHTQSQPIATFRVNANITEWRTRHTKRRAACNNFQVLQTQKSTCDDAYVAAQEWTNRTLFDHERFDV